MSQSAVSNIDSVDDPILAIESAINADEDKAVARSLLRKWLAEESGENASGATIGDILSAINRKQASSHIIAVVLIRCLSVEDLLPKSNSSNQIERNIVEICEKNLPELCKYIEIQPKSQTYEKFAILSNSHSKLCKILSPVTNPYGDLPALVRGKKSILGVLNHSIVRAYFNPFKLQDLKSVTEVLFSHHERVERLEASFLQDFEDCKRVIQDAKNTTEENASFLSKEIFLPFILTAESLLENFLVSIRSKFHAKIKKGKAGSQLQKRYPLHVTAQVVGFRPSEDWA